MGGCCEREGGERILYLRNWGLFIFFYFGFCSSVVSMRKGEGSSCSTNSKWDFVFYLCVSREAKFKSFTTMWFGFHFFGSWFSYTSYRGLLGLLIFIERCFLGIERRFLSF